MLNFQKHLGVFHRFFFLAKLDLEHFLCNTILWKPSNEISYIVANQEEGEGNRDSHVYDKIQRFRAPF